MLTTSTEHVSVQTPSTAGLSKNPGELLEFKVFPPCSSSMSTQQQQQQQQQQNNASNHHGPSLSIDITNAQQQQIPASLGSPSTLLNQPLLSPSSMMSPSIPSLTYASNGSTPMSALFGNALLTTKNPLTGFTPSTENAKFSFWDDALPPQSTFQKSSSSTPSSTGVQQQQQQQQQQQAYVQKLVRYQQEQQQQQQQQQQLQRNRRTSILLQPGEMGNLSNGGNNATEFFNPFSPAHIRTWDNPMLSPSSASALSLHQVTPNGLHHPPSPTTLRQMQFFNQQRMQLFAAAVNASNFVQGISPRAQTSANNSPSNSPAHKPFSSASSPSNSSSAANSMSSNRNLLNLSSIATNANAGNNKVNVFPPTPTTNKTPPSIPKTIRKTPSAQEKPTVVEARPVRIDPESGLKMRTACEVCTRLKVKCSGTAPCKVCVKQGCECIFTVQRKRGPCSLGDKATKKTKSQVIRAPNLEFQSLVQSAAIVGQQDISTKDEETDSRSSNSS